MNSPTTTTEMVLALMTGLSLGLASWAMISLWIESKKMTRDRSSMTEPPPALFRILAPLGAPLSKMFQDMIERAEKSPKRSNSTLLRFSQTIHTNITIAGLSGALVPADMIGTSFASALVGGGFGWYAAVMQDYSAPTLVLLGVSVGACLPFIWLNDRLKRRQIEIRKGLPYFLDLLTLCVEAGLDFSTALLRVLSKLGNSPLRFELDQVTNEITMGKSRAQALRDMADRIGLVELSTVVSAIVQSDELGSSLGPVLRIQSNEARRRRSSRAEELALKAPVKIVFPLVGFIFPTTFIIVFGPIALKYILPLFE